MKQFICPLDTIVITLFLLVIPFSFPLNIYVEHPSLETIQSYHLVYSAAIKASVIACIIVAMFSRQCFSNVTLKLSSPGIKPAIKGLKISLFLFSVFLCMAWYLAEIPLRFMLFFFEVYVVLSLYSLYILLRGNVRDHSE